MYGTISWGVLVLLDLLGGTHRLSELRGKIGGVNKIGGVSKQMLAQTLQWLGEEGFVLRAAFPVVPPHVEYRLTPMGLEAAQQVQGLADCIEGNLHRVLKVRSAREPDAPDPRLPLGPHRRAPVIRSG